MLLPRTAANATSSGFDPNHLLSHQGVQLNAETHAVFAVALMPMRAFSMAQAAERTTLGRLDAAMASMPKIRASLAGQGAPTNDRLLDELIDAHTKRRLCSVLT
ncbi:MAG: hypothetical protein WDN31_07175 [Hyphomicrobium sp.]